MKLLALILVALSLLSFTLAFKYDIERDQDDQETFVEEKEANQFIKRLLHPFSTKNEEIKRETREVYEEKCENVVPFGKR